MYDDKDCFMAEHWGLYRKQLDDTLAELRKDMRMLVQNTESLPRIGTGIDLLADRIENTNKDILQAALKQEHLPMATVNDMLVQITKSNSVLYRIFGAITLGLLSVIVFLLIGEKSEWIRELVRQY